jgi:hypothetical protein
MLDEARPQIATHRSERPLCGLAVSEHGDAAELLDLVDDV